MASISEPAGSSAASAASPRESPRGRGRPVRSRNPPQPHFLSARMEQPFDSVLRAMVELEEQSGGFVPFEPPRHMVASPERRGLARPEQGTPRVAHPLRACRPGCTRVNYPPDEWSECAVAVWQRALPGMRAGAPASQSVA
ncbi:hypothetical protein AB1Y20_004859 [Prymnesium parvum]|uniref:Uncharacterized protein n=1 Tax=Prymnesium parvum TaxID=97485 RepID=A0AB34IZD8_PRYPA